MTIPSSRTPTLVEAVRLAIESEVEDIYTALPGRIEEYDPSDQRASVKPLVQRLILDENGNDIVEPLPVIPDVPVIFPRSGAFFLSFPVKPGDFVMLMFQKSSIDKYLSGSGEDENPDEFRTHDLTDAVAYPGFYPFGQALQNADADQMVLGNDGGTGVAYFDEASVSIGAKGASDAAALESKVQTQLSAIRDSLDALVTTFNAHIHTASGPPGAPIVSPPTTTGTPPAAVQATNSTVLLLDS